MSLVGMHKHSSRLQQTVYKVFHVSTTTRSNAAGAVHVLHDCLLLAAAARVVEPGPVLQRSHMHNSCGCLRAAAHIAPTIGGAPVME